jgi:hypothetical protein
MSPTVEADADLTMVVFFLSARVRPKLAATEVSGCHLIPVICLLV